MIDKNLEEKEDFYNFTLGRRRSMCSSQRTAVAPIKGLGKIYSFVVQI